MTLALFSWLGTRPWVKDKFTNFEITCGILGKSILIILLDKMSKPWLVLGCNFEQASNISFLSTTLKTKFEGYLKPK